MTTADAKSKQSRKRNPANMAAKTIDVDLILFFHAVSQNLSFTRAAKQLGIDQSWLSHKIRQLEKIVGVKLFFRNTRSVELTAAGRTLCDSARQLTEGTERARAAAQLLKQSINGELAVGALPFSFKDSQRQRILDDFMTGHAKVKLSVINNSTPKLIEQLRHGRIDIAFVSAPIDEKLFDTLLLRENRYGLLVNKKHRLAQIDDLKFKHLSGEKIVIPARHYSPDAYDLIYKPAVDAGMVAVTTPEFESVSDYAMDFNLPVICNRFVSERYLNEDMVMKPLKELRTCRKYIIRLPSHRTATQNFLWDIARTHIKQPLPLH